MLLSETKVNEFKTKYCDENKIISSLYRAHLQGILPEPILDVGSGPGDLSARVFSDQRVTHLDILDYKESVLPPTHTRVVGDFFNYSPAPGSSIGTILFNHVFQYLDDSVPRLNQKISSLRPLNIVTVTNSNNDILGELIHWIQARCPMANPELTIRDFAPDYNLIGSWPFIATISCPNFFVLTEQIGYLMEASLSTSQQQELIVFLSEKLSSPQFSFHQEVRLYTQKNIQNDRTP